MATDVNTIQGKVNGYIRDTTNMSVTASDRLSAISQAVQDIMNELGLDHMVKTWKFSYLDGIHYYYTSVLLPDFMQAMEVRRREGDNYPPFTYRDNKKFVTELSDGSTDDSYTIEVKDGKTFLGVNHVSDFPAIVLHDCETYNGNGTWVADTSASDANTVDTDTVETTTGTGSVKFNVTVSQSGNNRATISNSTMGHINLTDHLNVSTIVADIYIPNETYISSGTLYWGNDSSNYYTNSAVKDIYGSTLSVGWNTIGVAWNGATQVGTVDVTQIGYLRYDLNYSASQTDMTGCRIDNIRSIRPENLYLYYESSAVGYTNTGTSLSAFASTTDVPFYSGIYDYFDNIVARRAAAILFDQMGMKNDYTSQMQEYMKGIRSIKTRFPHSTSKEVKTFRVSGNNLNK
jgi:hypothetical protein